MIMFALVVACAPESTSPASSAPVEGASEDSGTAPDIPMPEVWGVQGMEDHDPAPDVVEVHLRASESTAQWVDGEDPTPVWAYNDQVPGPLIQARVGDTLRVVFTNDLPEDETTIHWHGLRISDEMDGVPAVQNPVLPGAQFTYEFVVPDSGTFWYHPHVRTHEQVERGLQGALIVHEADELPLDRDRIFVLDDVLLYANGQIQRPDTIGHMDGMHGRHGNTLLTNGSTELLTDTVQPGAVERWRLVNTANARTMYADVTGAAWRVVGVDGQILVEGYEAAQVRLPVGRRWDLEVIPDLDAETVGLSVLLADGAGGFDRYPVFEAVVEGAALGGAPLDWPAMTMPDVQDALQDVTLNLNGVNGEDGLKWMINGAAYGEHDNIDVEGNTPTLITINEKSGNEHPFHLHGQFFQVLSRNGEQTDEDRGLMDTVLVEGDDEVVLYTDFDNPGIWMAHCHILEHAELGMMTEMHVSE